MTNSGLACLPLTSAMLRFLYSNACSLSWPTCRPVVPRVHSWSCRSHTGTSQTHFGVTRLLSTGTSGTPGEGAGRGGGAGGNGIYCLNSQGDTEISSSQSCLFISFIRSVTGAIRESGGALGKRQAALEEQYFYNIQKEQIKDLKKSHQEEIKYHEAEIRRHQVVCSRACVMNPVKL